MHTVIILIPVLVIVVSLYVIYRSRKSTKAAREFIKVTAPRPVVILPGGALDTPLVKLK